MTIRTFSFFLINTVKRAIYICQKNHLVVIIWRQGDFIQYLNIFIKFFLIMFAKIFYSANFTFWISSDTSISTMPNK